MITVVNYVLLVQIYLLPLKRGVMFVLVHARCNNINCYSYLQVHFKIRFPLARIHNKSRSKKKRDFLRLMIMLKTTTRLRRRSAAAAASPVFSSPLFSFLIVVLSFAVTARTATRITKIVEAADASTFSSSSQP